MSEQSENWWKIFLVHESTFAQITIDRVRRSFNSSFDALRAEGVETTVVNRPSSTDAWRGLLKGIPSSQCLVIDDIPDTIFAARKAGIRGVLFDPYFIEILPEGALIFTVDLGLSTEVEREGDLTDFTNFLMEVRQGVPPRIPGVKSALPETLDTGPAPEEQQPVEPADATEGSQSVRRRRIRNPRKTVKISETMPRQEQRSAQISIPVWEALKKAHQALLDEHQALSDAGKARQRRSKREPKSRECLPC